MAWAVIRADAVDLRNDVQVEGYPYIVTEVVMAGGPCPRTRLKPASGLLHEYLHGARGGINADGFSATTVRETDPSAVNLPVAGLPSQLPD